MSKLCQLTKPDGTFYSWVFHCPGCDSPHRCDARWAFNGDEVKPTFTGSVLVQYNGADADGPGGLPRICHSHVTDGRIQFLADCTHKLAGQTVDLPDWDRRHEKTP